MASHSKKQPTLRRAAPAKRAAVKRAPAKRAPTKRAAVKRAPAKRAPTKRAAVKRAPAKRAAVKRAPAKRAPARIEVQNLRTLGRSLRPAVAKNRKRAEHLIRDIERRKARVSEDFYRIGLALEELSRPPLIAAAGYHSFRELLEARHLMSAVTAYKLIAVVDQYPRAQARRIGFAKAYALTRFVAATPVEELASTLARQNPTIGRTPLDQMTVRQLQRATARVRKASAKTKTDPEAKAARRAARALQRTLRQAGAKSAKTRAVRLEGRWHLRTDMEVQDAQRWR